jgi:glutamyl-tRNA synthetase
MDEHLVALVAALESLGTFDPQSIEAALRSIADARGVKAATLIHALRVALTGKTVSPGLFEVASLLGRDRVLRRVHGATVKAAAMRGRA